MTVFNLGSINVDHVYRVAHLPRPGETLAATSFHSGLGGKGANQSVAAALAGAKVHHIGAVGSDGAWAMNRMHHFGVGVGSIARLDQPTGHAIINVDDKGENAIVLFAGANAAQSEAAVSAVLSAAEPGDTLLLQNETSLQPFAAAMGRTRAMRVIYSAAPFEMAAVRAVLPFISMIVCNEGEAGELTAALGLALTDLPVADVIVTLGSKGAIWHARGQHTLRQPGFKVEPVDTTGAGDCFIGALAAALDQGWSRVEAMRFASAAAAITVTRPGASDAMPTALETTRFLQANA